MDKQAREAKEQMKALSFKDKWTNFWYYYRVHVIAGIFAVVLIIFTAVECANRIDYDLNISYYSSIAINEDGINKVKEMLTESVEDINGNGAVDVGIAPCFANPDEMSEQTQAVMMKLSAEIAAGESMGFLIDEKYKEIFDRGYIEVAEKVVEIGSIPEVKEALGLSDGTKLYWVTRTVYETEKDKEAKLLEHENALKAEKVFTDKLK